MGRWRERWWPAPTGDWRKVLVNDATGHVCLEAWGGWCVVPGADPWPRVAVSGAVSGTLLLTGWRFGFPAWSGEGLKLFMDAGGGYVLSASSNPRYWTERATGATDGDALWDAASVSVSAVFSTRRAPSSGTWSPLGTASGTVSATWLWPRLPIDGGSGGPEGVYSTAGDGCQLAGPVVVGDLVFREGSARHVMSPDKASCGPATLSGGEWSIAGEGGRWTCAGDLAGAEEGDEFTFGWRADPGSGAQGQPSRTWVCEGPGGPVADEGWRCDWGRWE